MSIENFEDLFEDMLKDVYDSEKQIAKALPKMAKNASHDELRQAFEHHLEETHHQIERLEQIFDILEIKGKGQRCEATQGLIAEAQEEMGEVEDEQVRDAGMIACAQAVEHYEIARYGTLVAWAQKLGQRDIVKLLQETLREEHNANHLLNQLAEQNINDEALNASDDMDDDEEETRARGGRKSGGNGRGRQMPDGAHGRNGSQQVRSGGRPARAAGEGRAMAAQSRDASSRRSQDR